VANQGNQANQAAQEPVDIRYDNARRRLEITWADGQESAYDYEFLRWRCPCAECAGEMGQPGRLQFVDSLRPEQYELQSIELVGLYALRPTWADGHESGIYSFDRLRALSDDAAVDLRRKGTAPRPDGA
jgi:YD repeat-containing protein